MVYEKPEIEIDVFRLADSFAAEESDVFDPFNPFGANGTYIDVNGDEVFVGEDEGYVVN